MVLGDELWAGVPGEVTDPMLKVDDSKPLPGLIGSFKAENWLLELMDLDLKRVVLTFIRQHFGQIQQVTCWPSLLYSSCDKPKHSLCSHRSQPSHWRASALHVTSRLHLSHGNSGTGGSGWFGVGPGLDSRSPASRRIRWITSIDVLLPGVGASLGDSQLDLCMKLEYRVDCVSLVTCRPHPMGCCSARVW